MKMMRYTDGQGEVVECKATPSMMVWCGDHDIKFETFEQEPPKKVVMYGHVNGRYQLVIVGSPEYERKMNHEYWELTDIDPDDFTNNYDGYNDDDRDF